MSDSYNILPSISNLEVSHLIAVSFDEFWPTLLLSIVVLVIAIVRRQLSRQHGKTDHAMSHVTIQRHPYKYFACWPIYLWGLQTIINQYDIFNTLDLPYESGKYLFFLINIASLTVLLVVLLLMTVGIRLERSTYGFHKLANLATVQVVLVVVVADSLLFYAMYSLYWNACGL
jgi:hypothetical protein